MRYAVCDMCSSHNVLFLTQRRQRRGGDDGDDRGRCGPGAGHGRGMPADFWEWVHNQPAQPAKKGGILIFPFRKVQW